MSRPGRIGLRRLAPRNLGDTFGNSSRSSTSIPIEAWGIRPATRIPPGFERFEVFSATSQTVAPTIIQADGAVRSVRSARSSPPSHSEVSPEPAAPTGRVLECRVDTGSGSLHRLRDFEVNLRDRSVKLVMVRERRSLFGDVLRDVVEREVDVHPLADLSAILAHEKRDGSVVLSAPVAWPDCRCCFRVLAGEDPLTRHSEAPIRPQDRWCQIEGIGRLPVDSIG